MTARYDQAHIGLVVEGAGELQAVPVILRRRLQQRRIFEDILGAPVPCHGREKALRTSGIEGKVATAAVRPGCRGVLVLLDGEGDSVCRLGPELLSRATSSGGGKRVDVCLADPKFEAWLLASADTLGLPNMERWTTGDAVAAIKRALAPQKYVKPVWQPRLAHRMDLDVVANASRSFRRFIEKFDGLTDLVVAS